jgi:hypothetical protein
MSQSIKSVFKNILAPEQHWKLNLLNNWAAIIGSIGQYVHIEKIHDDTLILSVVDSCWMQELYLLSDLLLKKINQNLDEPRIKNLRFKQSSVRKKKVACAKVKPKPLHKNVLLSAQERAALEKIKDPQLSKALEEFLVRCYQE